MTLLIVNADDFGQSESINRGILDAHTGGILTSTTWLAGGDAAEDAVELAAPVPQLEVGLHLALSTVRPVGDPSAFAGVLDSQGRWPSRYPAVLRWMATSRGSRAVVEAEWRAQIERFIAQWGRLPSHLDSHQHIALLPGLMRIVIELAVEFSIPAIRVPSEVRDFGDIPAPRAFHRLHETLVLSVLAARHRGLAGRSGIATTVSFAGFRQSGRMDEATLLSLLPRLGERGSSVELMMHPGDVDEPGGYWRRRERDALMSPRVRVAVEDHGLQLGRFSSLP